MSTPHIHRLAIKGFQSLHDVSVDLSGLTVIVGPSSSGKSAFTRALRTLVSNRRGTEWITHGAKTASISAQTDRGTVTLTRSRTTSSAENAYTLTPADDPSAQRVYAKLGGETPEDVSRFLGIASTNPINFASQFDKPFLLDDSAAEVARTLGALTNVNVVFEAARESNRRKLAASSTLKTRAADLEAVKARIPEFQALKAADAALQQAEAKIAAARILETRIATLAHTIEILEATEPLIERLTPQASMHIPDESRVLEAQQALDAFQHALQRVPQATKLVTAAQQAYDATEDAEAQLLASYAELTGGLADDLEGFLLSHTRPRVDDGAQWILVDEAVKAFVRFLETKASV